MGRPQIELDPVLVQSLANAQLTNVEIAEICNCEEKTLTRRFGESLKRWKDEGVGSVRRKLFTRAMDDKYPGATTAMIFFLKNYGGMADVTREQNRPAETNDIPLPREFSATDSSRKPN